MRIVVALAAGCTSVATTRDASFDSVTPGADVVSSGCVMAGVVCQGDRAIRCAAVGAEPIVTRCAGPTPACSNGVGCTACPAGARFCNADDPSVIEQCDATGASSTRAARCDDPARPICVAGSCVDACAETRGSPGSLGCEFWAVSTANTVRDIFTYAVVVANPQPYTVRVRVSGGALSTPIERSIPRGAVETIALPWVTALSVNALRNIAESARIANGAYRVESNAPIAAYQFNPLEYRIEMANSQSNDASLLLPTTALSGRYVVTTFPSHRPSPFVAIVGTFDGTTTVTLRATANLVAGNGVMRIAAGSTVALTLARGEVLQLMPEPTMNPGEPPTTSDLSGSTLDADHPIAVFAGHTCAYVPANNGFCDHLEEQLPPIESWGAEAFVAPFIDRPTVPSTVRVTAQRANTMVTFDPPTVRAAATLGANETVEFEAGEPVHVRASAPIAVVQYMSGERPRMVERYGSPAMVLQLPPAQFRTSYDVLVPSTYDRNFVNLVGRMDANVRMDGVEVMASPRAIGSSGWGVRSLEVPAGAHRFESTISGSPFGITVYGVGAATSYAYPGGINLTVINSPG